MIRRHPAIALLLFLGLVSTLVAFSYRQDEPRSIAIEPETIKAVNQALALEKQSRFKDALAEIRSVRSSNPMIVFQLIQLKQRLAAQIFDRAAQEFSKGNVEKAIQFASAIPADAPAWNHYQKVQRSWMHNQAILDLARLYQSQGSSVLAIDLLAQLDPAVRSGRTATTLAKQAQIQIAQARDIASMPAQEVVPVSLPETAEPEYAPRHDSYEIEPVPRESLHPNRIPFRAAPTISRSLGSEKSSKPQSQSCNDPTCDFSGFRK